MPPPLSPLPRDDDLCRRGGLLWLIGGDFSARRVSVPPLFTGESFFVLSGGVSLLRDCLSARDFAGDRADRAAGGGCSRVALSVISFLGAFSFSFSALSCFMDFFGLSTELRKKAARVKRKIVE